MTYSEAFEKIKKELKNADVKNISENFAVQINLSDEDCHGMLYIEVKDGELYVEPYDYYDRRALITADFKVIKDIFSGKSDVFAASAAGTALIEGDETCIDLIAKSIKKSTPKPRSIVKKEPKAAPTAKKTEAAKKITEKKKKEK